ncbi:hypothetical protein [Nocardia altamirensis]|uniref:hypothetical protein n=1 Tax=Nocardia altamirensis TaxID=472158 RepID=UPI0008408E40|nr:hypothetical protein [Nocardia altamirensis]
MTKPPETLTIGTTTYRVQMGTFTATLIGPRGGIYTAVQNVHSGLFSVINASARELRKPGTSRPLRLRRTGDRFEIL